ncbi:hypothetical protein FN846DRAFT_757408, partial [Sphaerosporella brunnea]
LHAYLPLVTADMPGREKLMHLKGNRAYSFCNYCLCRGIHDGRAIYCPFTPPEDPPAGIVDDTEKARKAGYPWPSHNRWQLPLRSNDDFRQNAGYIASDPGHNAAQRKTGIGGQSILHHLSSIDFPRSFPPDAMHLFYENIVPNMVRHYRGVFFKPALDTSNDSWNVQPAHWTQIGQYQQTSRDTLPASFGRAPRNFASHCHEFSGEEWKQQAHLFLPIYLQDILPNDHYEQFCALTQAMN